MQKSKSGVRFQKATIFGVGLIGGSFALAMKKHKLCDEITGCGRNEENLKRAEERKIIDSFDLDPVEACKDSDIILFATPVGIFKNIAKKIARTLKTGAIVTDVGSVKGELVYDIENILPEKVFFVGAHPIAGSDRSGIDTASAQLFRNAKCIITPTDHTNEEALSKIVDIWKIFGSDVKITDPREHDRIYGAISHLPHLLAYLLVNTVSDIDSSYLSFSGQGFRDTTRIAASHPEIWKDICIFNRDNLLEYIEIFRDRLDRADKYLRASDAKSLEKEFGSARKLRENLGQN